MAEELIQRLNAGGKLPVPPAVVLRILELTRRTDGSVAELADTIALDPGLSAKILRFVNSPMCGASREVTSLRQAVALMGLRGVKMMALSFSIVASGKKNACGGFDPRHFAIHSLACGTAAKTFAELTETSHAQDAFSAGLLSQLGRSILASSMPEEYATIVARADCIPADLPPLERAAWGETYATVGGAVLRSWGLPRAMCTAVSSFRDTKGESDGPPLVRLLALAERAADLVCPDRTDRGLDPRTYLDCATAAFGLSRETALGALSTIASEVDQVRAIIEVDRASLRSAEEIDGEVRERIAELSLAMHLDNQNMAMQQEELMRRATTDALTGIGNRAAFDARLGFELERALRDGGPLALLMMDVDRFKSFNDTFGHPIGDRVLQAVARALDDNIRKVDLVARYGGEEFAVIAANTPVEHSIHLAERLRKSVADASVESEAGTLSVTVSVGVAVLNDVSDPTTDGPRLIKLADKSLYRAKRNGRNRVEVDDAARTFVAR